MSFITVVGGGPVGLQTALNLKQNGFDVSLIEEHREIGKPVQCAGLISKTGYNELKLNTEEAIVNEIKGARIFSPRGIELKIKKSETAAYVIDRYKFDQSFYKKALKAGLEVNLNSKLLDIRKDSLFLETKGHGELKKSKIIVGADGANSIVRHIIMQDIPQENFVHTFQIRAKGIFNPEFVELHFGELAKGLFTWIIPENNSTARIGLATKMGENPAENLKKFVEKKGLVLDVLDKTSALIPIAKPLKTAVKENILLVGDSGFHTKADTGGGIIFGLKAANICSETISNHLKKHKSLAEYDKNLGALNKELLTHWKIHSFIQKTPPNKIDEFFYRAKKAGIEEFLSEHGDMDKPSSFIGKAMRTPKLWGLIPELMKII